MDEQVKRLREVEKMLKVAQFKEAVNLIEQAADAIEELTRENESLAKSVNEASEILRKRWIPVAEQLPSEDGFTLIFTAHGNPGVCYFTNGWWGGYDKDGITHWMPLPEPPEEERA